MDTQSCRAAKIIHSYLHCAVHFRSGEPPSERHNQVILRIQFGYFATRNYGQNKIMNQPLNARISKAQVSRYHSIVPSAFMDCQGRFQTGSITYKPS